MDSISNCYVEQNNESANIDTGLNYYIYVGRYDCLVHLLLLTHQPKNCYDELRSNISYDVRFFQFYNTYDNAYDNAYDIAYHLMI